MPRHRTLPDPPVGTVYGPPDGPHWTVTGPAPPPASRPHERRMTCRCTCGVVMRVNLKSLRDGTSFRCPGCADLARSANAACRALTVRPGSGYGARKRPRGSSGTDGG